MGKRIQECPRCGGNLIEREDPSSGFYSQCLQCGRGKPATNPREMQTLRVNGGHALPELAPVHVWQA